LARPTSASGRGGWAFQFANQFYPDLDDTAVVAWAMHQAPDSSRYAESVRRALDWLVGMQSRDGGFAAFDADNTCYYLNKIPFADHGALLDPPTSDVTARVVTVLARIGRPEDKAALERAIAYLRREQEADGSWFGRWGTNYIYGTWSVLMSLAQAHVGPGDPMVRRALAWLIRKQNPDGGWGESNDSYALQARPRRISAVLRTRPPGRCWGCCRPARLDPMRRGAPLITCCMHGKPMAFGIIPAIPRRVSRACFICATTAIQPIFPCGRSPPTGT